MLANLKTRILTVLAAIVGCSPLAAASDDHYITKQQWIDAVAIAGVPSEVLYAMSLQESGTTFKGKRDYAPWPWVLNVRSTETYVEDGVEKTRKVNRAKFFESREKARAFLANEIAKGNQYVAVGMYQIYIKFNAHYVEDKLSLLDPSVNLYVAAKVLEECGLRFKSMKEKLGCYYSGEYDEDGQKYANNVLGIAERWGKPYVMRANYKTQSDNANVTMVASVAPSRSPKYAEFLKMLKQRGGDTETARMIVVGGTEQ
jgi:hypothetical protein